MRRHDADGVSSWEACYPEFCAAVASEVGVDCGKNETVPFDVTARGAVEALEDIVLGALDEIGVDFYWIDYQQVRSEHRVFS